MKRTKDHVKNSLAVEAELEVEALLVRAGSKYKNSYKEAVSLESLTDDQYELYVSVESELKEDLKRLPSFDRILKQAKGRNDEETLRLQELGLEAASYSLLAHLNPKNYYDLKTVNHPTPLGSNIEGMVVNPMDGGTPYALESFDPVSAAKYSVTTAIASAQAAVLGGFEDAFFPARLVPAGQNGVDMQITIPKVMAQSPQPSLSAAPYTYTISKTSLIEALVFPSILESNATTVVPFTGTAGSYPAWAVPATTVPNWSVTTQGTSVTTGALLFSTPIAAIAASDLSIVLQNPGIVLDETDSLSPIMNIGTVFWKAVITVSGTPYTLYLSQDISNQPKSLLTQVQQGRIQEYQTTGTFQLTINNSANFNSPGSGTTVSPTSNALTTGALTTSPTTLATFFTEVATVLGVSAGSNIALNFSVRLSATGDTELGNFNVDVGGGTVANAISLASVYVNGIQTWVNTNNVSGVYATLVTDLVATPVGYYPILLRTNSNLRNNGTIIDANTTKLYRYAVQLSAPIISQNPIGTNNTTSLEALSQTARIRQNGRAVAALQNLETVLQAADGIALNAPFPGSEFVTPSYVYQQIDVQQFVANLSSMDSLQNLRGAVRAAITNMVNQLLITSHYPAALEMAGENPDNFEIILVTDQELAPHFTVDGDIREFGDGRDYAITKSNNAFFSGSSTTGNRVSKVYFSFRRKTRTDDLHPLDFGRMLITPPITYDVQVNRNQRTTQEIHTIPRVNAYVFLPILGRLDVYNLEALYVLSPINQIAAPTTLLPLGY